MTRVKETEPGSGKIPNYKSPSSRINESLRKGYDNLRCRIKKKSDQLDNLRGNKRDIEKSRDKWKAEAKSYAKQVEELQSRLDKLEEEKKLLTFLLLLQKS